MRDQIKYFKQFELSIYQYSCLTFICLCSPTKHDIYGSYHANTHNLKCHVSRNTFSMSS